MQVWEYDNTLFYCLIFDGVGSKG